MKMKRPTKDFLSLISPSTKPTIFPYALSVISNDHSLINSIAFLKPLSLPQKLT